MNIYLIVSESFNIINSEVGKIVPAGFPLIKYDLRQNTITEVINEANYFSLTGEKKYILVKCGEFFKPSKKRNNEDNEITDEDEEEILEKENAEVKLLEKYLEKPSDNSIIIFTSQIFPDKRKKLYKQFNKVGRVIDIPALNKKELVYKCMDILKGKKYKIDYNTANFIVENSYTNYDIMLNEIEKIYILLKPCELTEKILSDVIAHGRNNNLYNYINSLIECNLRLAIKYSEDFESLKIDPVVIIITLYKELQIYYLIKSGVSYNEIKSIYHKEDWQMKNYMDKKDRFNLSELKKIIIKLNDYDFKYKNGLLDKSVIVDLITLDFCEN